MKPISRHAADFDFRASGDDLRSVLSSVYGFAPDEARFSIDLRGTLRKTEVSLDKLDLANDPAPALSDGRLIPDIDIPFDQMRKLDASVKLDIGKLQRDTFNVTNLKLDTELRDGKFYLHDFEFQAPAGWLQARGTLGPSDGFGVATFAATGRGVALGLSQFNTNLLGKSDFDIHLESTGADVRSLLGNLNGIIFAHSTNLVVPRNRFLQRLYGDMLNEVVSAVNPFSKSNKLHRLDCVILPVEITNGVLDTQPYAFALLSNARMVIDLAIDLQTEKIEMQMRTTPRKGLTISAGEILNPYVKIVGTLAKPSLAVDEQGMLISGSAAVATGGLSILAKALWERLSRTRKPCQRAAEQSKATLGDRFPDFSLLVDAPAS